ncbi:hypothetical protein RhiJN_13142 [Ceratobasidium sp. AG-Ba]|nr:hypothetical protein RhiJN_08774 [Ceratobasidium sp. AG-Ba]QRV85124.1 hypothetical protein RhiJN_13142 [Ceratobasidium sp. AG-Ba]QRW13706.1 hypothetical protein RhiLY_12705 [Ceratobasidium sp. AG-Ba]
MPRRKFEFENAVLSVGHIHVALANDMDEHLNASFSCNGTLLSQSPLAPHCWVALKVKERFSVHVGFDGVSVPYPNAGGLVATVFFDGVRVSDAFIAADSITRRVLELRELTATTDDVWGATEICGSPGDEGMMGRFTFEHRDTAANGFPWPYPDSLGQIRVEVRWASLTLGLPGSMKHLYAEAGLLSTVIETRSLGKHHGFVAALEPAEIDPQVKAERQSEGGFRFEHVPLDDEVYTFTFHYAPEKVLRKKGYMRVLRE